MGYDVRIDVEAAVSDTQACCQLVAQFWAAAAAGTKASFVIVCHSAAARSQPASTVIACVGACLFRFPPFFGRTLLCSHCMLVHARMLRINSKKELPPRVVCMLTGMDAAV